MTARWVIPTVDGAYLAACTNSLHPGIRERLTVVDNTGPGRLSVAASWNAGIDDMAAAGGDWLVICSESMRFGPAGGTDLDARLNALTGGWVTAECDQTCTVVETTGAGFCRNGYGFHLIALSAQLIGSVGRFDERYTPAFWEDCDYLHRIDLSGIGGAVHLTNVDAHLAACEHSVAAGFVTASWADNAHVYISRWGGPPGEEQW